jgi:hypothetical protein
MTTREDAYWDELGVTWTAIDPDIGVIASRLKARLRRQSLLIGAGVILGLILTVAALALGSYTIWIGVATGAWNFVARGIAIGVIALLLARGVTVLLPVRASGGARSLSDMLDLAIARAHRTLAIVRLGFSASVIAAVFGLLGTAIRTHLTRPPRLSPMVDLLILAALALGLHFYGRQVKATAEKLRALKHAVAKNGIA